MVSLNQLKDDDISPLIDAFLTVDSSDIDAVDILHESPCNLNEEHIMSLLHAINLKLRIVDLQDMSLEQDLLGFVSAPKSVLCSNALFSSYFHLTARFLAVEMTFLH